MPSTDQALAMAAIPNHGLALCEAICAGNEADMPYRNFLKFVCAGLSGAKASFSLPPFATIQDGNRPSAPATQTRHPGLPWV